MDTLINLITKESSKNLLKTATETAVKSVAAKGAEKLVNEIDRQVRKKIKKPNQTKDQPLQPVLDQPQEKKIIKEDKEIQDIFSGSAIKFIF